MASSQGHEPNSTHSRDLGAESHSTANANDGANDGANGGARDASTNQHPRPPEVFPAPASGSASGSTSHAFIRPIHPRHPPVNGPPNLSSSSSSRPSNANFNPRRVSRESAGVNYTHTHNQAQAQAQAQGQGEQTQGQGQRTQGQFRDYSHDAHFLDHLIPYIPPRSSRSASGTGPNRPVSHRRTSAVSNIPPVQDPVTPESESSQRRAWSQSPYLSGDTPGSPGFRSLSPIREGFREDTFPPPSAPPPRLGRGGYGGVSQQPRGPAGSTPNIPPDFSLYPNSRYPRIGNSPTHDDLEERLRRHSAETQDYPPSRIPIPFISRARPRGAPASASSTTASGPAGPSGSQRPGDFRRPPSDSQQPSDSQRPSSGSSSDSVSLRGGGYDHHLSISQDSGSYNYRCRRDRGRSQSRSPPRRRRDREPSPPRRRRQQSGALNAQSNRQPHIANTVGSNRPEAPDAAVSNLSAPKKPTTSEHKEADSKDDRSNEKDIELKGEHPRESLNDKQLKVKDQSKGANVKMTPRIGPHPGHIRVSRQYYFEHSIRRKLSKPGVDPSREEDMRLRGVQNIQELKQELRL